MAHGRYGRALATLVDPHARRMYTCEAGLTEVASLKVPELGVELTPTEIFE